MLKNTGSWLYCDQCDKTVGYLCYSTYQSFLFEFDCKCGSSGSLNLNYDAQNSVVESSVGLEKIKNRLCCPNDEAPLFSIVYKHIEAYSYSVVCNKYLSRYKSNGAT